MSEYRAYNGKIDYDVDMWSNGDMYKSQYDSQRVYTNNIISSNTQNSYTVRDTTIDDQFEEQTQTIERYIYAMEQLEEETEIQQDAQETIETQQITQNQQMVQTQQVAQQQATQVQQAQQVAQQQAIQAQQTQQVAQQQAAQAQQTQQYTTNQVQSLYNQQVDQAFNDIEVLS